MDCCDVAVIGGGILGCFAARNLTRYALDVVLLEKESDVCTGVSKANTAIVYAGYDNEPGSLKAELTVKANRDFDNLCTELDVPFSRCGSLMLGFGEKSTKEIEKKLEKGLKNGVDGLEILNAAESKSIEPELDDHFSCALYSSTTGVVDPWRLCYAAYENALNNGCRTKLNTELMGIEKAEAGYVLNTNKGHFFARAVINCAGLFADKVHEMLFDPTTRISVNSGDYLVVERAASKLAHVIFCEGEGGKGITAVPTTEGSILLGPTTRENNPGYLSTDGAGLKTVVTEAKKILPHLKTDKILHSFAANRPNPHGVKIENGECISDNRSIGSFVIENPEPGFISLIGIKTPGLTCANELGKMVSDIIANALNANINSAYVPERKAIPSPREMEIGKRKELVECCPDYGDVVCICNEITRGEIIEAIQRGAVTIDGIKRRTGVMLGACQGARCKYRLAQILSEKLGAPVWSFLDKDKEYEKS